MSKSLVFANGRLHVGLDEHGLVNDLYFPHVGLENHLQPHGFPHKIGVFVDGQLSWLHDAGWSVSAKYHDSAMVGDTAATNDTLGIRLELTDVVDSELDMFVRSIHIINLRADARNVTLYCHQAFQIGDTLSSDSVQYRPDLPAVMHYKGNRVFVSSLVSEDGWFDDFSVGTYDAPSNSGTFRDAEDGKLEKNTSENGRVDSTLGLTFEVGGYDSARASYVLVASESVRGAEQLLDKFATNGALHYMARTAAYWHKWALGASIPAKLESYKKIIDQSLFVIAAHTDADGAVMASLDSSLRDHPQDDAYNFCWARDASYALWPLLRLGYTSELLRFFDFCVRGLHDDGYLYHKYRADGSLGSTWLPYQQPDGSVHPPLQADETASVLFLLGQYFRHTNEQAFLEQYYESLVEPMANFLAGFTSEDGLPRPSYDLWEHAYEVNTYTTAVTYAALVEASELAEAYERSEDSVRWRHAADAMKSASSCLYNTSKKYFYKGFSYDEEGEKQFDDLLDISSLYGAFIYGLFDAESKEIDESVASARTIFKKDDLYIRFVGDNYYGDTSSPNLWPVVSLWMSQIALERGEVEEAMTTLRAVMALAGPSGLLPEQVDPENHASTSLTPLVWSHAELVSTLIDYTQTEGTSL